MELHRTRSSQHSERSSLHCWTARQARTTHITGTVTDIGIELGRLLYRNASGTLPQYKVGGNWDKLRFLTSLAACFFLGGVAGALGFKHLGYISTVPLATRS